MWKDGPTATNGTWSSSDEFADHERDSKQSIEGARHDCDLCWSQGEALHLESNDIF